jgi:dihydroxy-acid dehydratase
VRIDLNKGTADILISKEELAKRRAALQKHPYHYPDNQTPWQEIQRGMVEQFDEGMVLKPAVKYQRVAQASGVPRDNH